jgi:hypothetical protein
MDVVKFLEGNLQYNDLLAGLGLDQVAIEAGGHFRRVGYVLTE